MKKAEAEVISVALIVMLALLFVSITYTWLYPWMEIKQERIRVERLLSDFDPNNPKSLPRRIEYVAERGGEVSFRISSDGIWKIYPSSYIGPENNSLEFFIFSKAVTERISIGMWKSFTEGVTCPPSKGSIDEIPYAVCVRADPHGDGYNITYRVTFRELEKDAIKGNKINLEKWTAISPDSSTSRDIKIKREDVYSRLLDGKTLIITEIRISFG